MRFRALLRAGLTAGLAATVALGVTAAAPSTTAAASTAGVARTAATAVHGQDPRVVTTFPGGTDGAFAESLAVDRSGRLFVSLTTWMQTGWNHGQVWMVTPGGTRTAFGPQLDAGVLTGLAFDESGRLYVGLAAWQDPTLPTLAPGVFRINTNGTATRVLTLPNGKDGVAAFPNGLAFHDGYLYVSDSTGAIWRTHPSGTRNDVQRTPWLRAKVLAPSVGELGINGITFRGETLYGVVADTGLVVRVPLVRGGQAGRLSTVARSSALVSADGIAFDSYGTLWVTANRGTVKGGGALLTVSPRGKVSVVAEHPTWLDYPTQAAFGRTSRDRSTLYITNGAFDSDGISDVTAVHVNLPSATITHAAPATPTVAVYLPTPGAQINGANQRAPLRIANLVANEGSITSIVVTYSSAAKHSSTTVSVPLGTDPTAIHYATITGLTNGTRYTFAVRVCNSVGRCSTSAPIRFTPYGVPEAGAIRAALSGQTITVSWDAVITNFSPIAFTSCTVSLTSNREDATAPAPRSVGLTSGTFSFSGKAGTAYQARKLCTNSRITNISTSATVTVPAA